MHREIAELQRRLANLIRVGKVVAVQHSNPPRVKVAFNGVTSPWMPWATGRSGEAKEWNPPSIGEQVTMLSPYGEFSSGYVIPGGIPSNDHPAADDRPGVWRIDAPAAAEIHVGSTVITIDGGKVSVAVGGSTLAVTSGMVTFDGDIEVTGDVKAGAISLKTHVHSGVSSGGSLTAPPVP